MMSGPLKSVSDPIPDGRPLHVRARAMANAAMAQVRGYLKNQQIIGASGSLQDLQNLQRKANTLEEIATRLEELERGKD